MWGSSGDQVVIDGMSVDLIDPAVYTVIPPRHEASRRADETAAAAAILPPTGDTLRSLEVLFARDLSENGLVDAVVALERQVAALQAKQQEFLTEIARRDPDGSAFLRAEVGPALRLAPGTAAQRLEAAIALTGRLWDTRELMSDGHLPYAHGRILAEATERLPDDVTAKVQERVLRRAPGQTPGEFRASVRRAVAVFDRKDQAQRRREAVAERRVISEPAPDGMSWINLFLPDDGAAVFLGAVNAWASKTGPGDTRTLDQLRADGAVELALAGLAMPGLPTSHGLRPVINVTLAASTLTGADELPALLNGQPVPAQVARHWARHPGASWRYWAVDEHGQIQDSDLAGHDLTTGSYTPTARIARHVTTRDGACVWPGCRRPAAQSQIDHRTPWPDGETDASNLQVLCKHHHDAKHATWRVHRTTDGTYHWTSPTRHRYRYRPPEHPVPEPDRPPATDGEPPPPF